MYLHTLHTHKGVVVDRCRGGSLGTLTTPQLVGEVVRAGGDALRVARDVRVDHLAVVPNQLLDRRPDRVSPQLGRLVERARHQEVTIDGYGKRSSGVGEEG